MNGENPGGGKAVRETQLRTPRRLFLVFAAVGKQRSRGLEDSGGGNAARETQLGTLRQLGALRRLLLVFATTNM